MRIACVAGARPNFMKIGPILAAIRRRAGLEPFLIHTGQHYSPEMSDIFFRDLGLPQPDLHLGAGGGTSVGQIAEIMRRLEPALLELRPDLLVVVGDVNSTAAAALTAAHLGIRLAHVEAGLRSFDRSMPEEVNRVVTDSLADLLFVTEPSAERNLAAEGIPPSRVFFVGNVMIDTLLRLKPLAERSAILGQLGVAPGGYALVTLHRPSNVDRLDRLGELIGMLDEVASSLPVLFPIHPRTLARMEAAGIHPGRIRLLPAQGYIDFLALLQSARLVLTDSGGIQEETTVLGVPCLTLRENTERPVTVEQGTNRLIGTSAAAALSAVREVLGNAAPAPRSIRFWDGQAAERIADVLAGCTRCPALTY